MKNKDRFKKDLDLLVHYVRACELSKGYAMYQDEARLRYHALLNEYGEILDELDNLRNKNWKESKHDT